VSLTPFFADLLEQVRLCLRQQRVFGSSRFQRQVEAKLKRFAGTRPAHRPRREPST
jgi:putative transposase